MKTVSTSRLPRSSRRESNSSPACFFAALIFGLVFVAFSTVLPAYTSAEPNDSTANRSSALPLWTEVEKGYAVARYGLGNENKVLRCEVLLLRFDPSVFSFEVKLASELGPKHTDLRTLTQKVNGIAGINAHFFDKKGDPLGIVISDRSKKNRMHRGGNLLTGIFYVHRNKAHIIHRKDFADVQAENALQSGPRLIADGKALSLSSPRATSRRSGIAVDRYGNVILYATLLRFPGASLAQIQNMLLDSRIDVTDALNLDGGGSSQLFVRKNSALVDDTFISGGDNVPVGLIVTRKN